MSTQMILVLTVGATLCLALGWYALILWRKVWLQQRQQAEQAQANRQKQAADLNVLINSLLDEQAPWVELCIRIKVVLDHYDYELGQQDEYQVFQLIYQACENIPTHQAWKELPKAERRAYEADFARLEEQHKEATLKSARTLQQLLA